MHAYCMAEGEHLDLVHRIQRHPEGLSKSLLKLKGPSEERSKQIEAMPLDELRKAVAAYEVWVTVSACSARLASFELRQRIRAERRKENRPLTFERPTGSMRE